MSLQDCLSPSSLVFMPKRPVAHDQRDPHVKESQGNQGLYWNALVFLSARILSHCGFVLSLFAIWMAWLMPTALIQQPELPDMKKFKSRTKNLQSHTHTNLASILATNPADNYPPRRVYFADEAPDPTIMKQTTVAEPLTRATTPSQTTTPSPQHSSLLFSSESSLGPSESVDGLVPDSDSSRRSSLKRSSKLAKFKLGFRSSSLDVATKSSVSGDEPAASPLGFSFLLKGQQPSVLPPKTFRRCSLPVERDSRNPKPIPRTRPYGPPYFANPPILLNDHYLTDRPQFKDELSNSRAPESDPETPRGRTIRRVALTDNH